MSEPKAKPVKPIVDAEAIDVDDVPVPEADYSSGQINDVFAFEPAYKFAFLGIGQGGNRLAEHFWKLGYRRVVILNTTNQDMDAIGVPAANKLNLDVGGAGKDPIAAALAFRGHEEDLYDLLQRCWGDGPIDYAIISFGAGGGTGAGIWPLAYPVIKRRTDKIGAVVALPKDDEGPRPKQNTIYTLEKLTLYPLSPLFLLDNERIRKLYPKQPVANYWHAYNQSICTLIHLFNRLAGASSKYKPLDRADFSSVLDKGIVVPGATVMKNPKTGADIAEAIRAQLKSNVLADVDLATSSAAACVFVGGQSIFDSLPIEFIDYAQAAVGRLLKPSAVVHAAVYPGAANDLRCYVMVGGLAMPSGRLMETAN